MRRNAFVEQFALIARETPDAVAVDTERTTLTYAELDAWSGRIANAVLAAGVVPGTDTVVGLFLGADEAYVAALLGVAKAGAVFMPLPPDLPERRVDLCLAQARCDLVATDAEGAARLGGRVRVIRVDAGLDAHSDKAPDIAFRPNDGVYVMHTSGSTGAPKAILGRQRGLSHFLRWEIEEFGLDAGTRVSWLAPINFDVSLRDILIPLMVGGTLCVPSPDTRTMPHRLTAWLAERRVTLVHCVPTVLRLITRELERRVSDEPAFPALRRLLSAGEPLFVRDVTSFRAASRGTTEVVNVYGPSETTLAKVFNRLGELPDEPRKVLPIGRPLPNTEILIIGDGRLLGVGDIGEIHIRTPYRTAGYLNDPDATAAVFVPNPLGNDPTDIVYKSGDLGRVTEDGIIECLGRVDGQVKINGVRIELGEIETALRAVPDIADAAAAAHTGADDQKTLVAYYSRRDGRTEPLPEEAIRAEIERTLPAQVSPRLFVVLPELPRTISGKLNRRALPRPEALFHEQHGYTAPEGETEIKTAGVWSAVLGFDKIGAETRFTAYGGDSLRAIKIIAALHETFGVEVTLRDFFEEPTVRALARLVADRRPGRSAVPRLPDAPHYPVSPSQRRLWRLHRMGIAPTAYNLAESFVLEGVVDVDALEGALRDVVGRHESFRTTFVEVDGEPRQIVHPAIDWSLARLDLSAVPDPTAEAARLFDANRDFVFDLEKGPLIRATLARLPAGPDGTPRDLLLVNIHHIVADVWSLGVMVREIEEGYAARRRGLSLERPAPRIGFRDYAGWLADRLADPEMDEHRAFWLDRLAGPLPVSHLPSDRPRPPVQSFAGSTLRFRVAADTTARLADLARERGVTRFSVLNALVKTLLHRLSGDEDIIVGSPVFGREHPDLADQIGCYVNVLALRDRVSGDLPFAGFLERVHAGVTAALAHQEYPFDALIEALDLDRDMSRSPVFDVMVVEQAFERVDLELEGVRRSVFGREEDAWKFSRYDLVFHVQPEDGELVLDINFNTDLFDEARIARLGRRFAELARAAALAPDTPLRDLPLMDGAEAAEIEAWSIGPVRPRPADATMWSVFEDAAGRAGAEPALITADRTMSYAETLAAADRLGRILAGVHGVAPGERVVVLARRSIPSVLAMLALLRIGAVYVPVDPEYPEARVRMSVEGAGSRLLLVDDDADLSLLPGGTTAVALSVPALLALAPPDLDPARPGPRDAAYVIFTSGSTGVPKGVVVEHAGLVNTALTMVEEFGLRPGERVMQFSSPSFDASVINMFKTLAGGAAIVLPPPAAIGSPAEYLRFGAETGTTVVTLPPVYTRLLEGAPMPFLRVLLSAGEAAPVDELTRYAESMAVYNAYGPTEASVCASFHRVVPADRARPRLPIGKPLPNTTLRILDSAMNPAPVGVDGAVWLGGAGLARGYLGDDARTAERFVVHPRTGERLYRTGDVGRWLEDGTVDFLGRDDGQVKVRGHRVELGDVEAAIRSVPGVRDAHVRAVERDGTSALVGWYVPERKPELWPSVAEFFVYDDVTYGAMAGHEERNARYLRAFAKRVVGKTVIDIGTGPFAILARLAVQAGARKVYAVDRLPESARKARATVADLGLSDKIEVVEGDASTVSLPEPIDICISEIVGGIGGSEGAALIINESRRLLRDPSAMLPKRSLTLMAGVELPEEALGGGFTDIAAHYVEAIFAEVGRPFDLRLCVKNLPSSAIVTDSGPFEDLDYTRPIPLEETHDVTLVVRRDARLTGFIVWLTLHVDEENVLDILESPDSWLPVYLPAFPAGIEAKAGDRIVGSVERRLCPNGLNPDFIVSGSIVRGDAVVAEFRHVSAHFGAGFREEPFHARLFAGAEVPRSDRPVPTNALVRRHLARTLPTHAVPAHLVELPAMPMTVNGKVDVDKLPEWSATPVEAPATAAPGGDARVDAVLAVWREVLERPDLGPDDNFFEFGGDSIRAIQIVSRLAKRGLRADIRDVFQNPVAAQFAEIVHEPKRMLERGPVDGPLPLGPIQRWFFDMGGVDRAHFNQAVQLVSDRSLDRGAVETAVRALWVHHDALRSTFRVAGDEVSAIILSADTPAPSLRVVPADGWTEAAAAAHAGFDLESGPLLAALFDGECRVLLIAHHLVVDGVSWRVLLEDFETALDAAARGSAPVLPDKSNSYRDYAEAEAARFATADRSSVEAYAARIGDAEPVPTGEAVTVERVLGAEETERVRAHPAGLEILVLAAAGEAARAVLGRESVIADLERHGRDGFDDLDLSRTVGWFTTFHPVRLDAPRAPDAESLIATTAAAAAELADGGRAMALLRRRPRADVGVNYLGVLSVGGGSGLTTDWDAPGPAVAPGTPPVHAIEVLAHVEAGRLRLAVTAGTERATELADALQSSLRRLGGGDDAFAGWDDDAVGALLDAE